MLDVEEMVDWLSNRVDGQLCNTILDIKSGQIMESIRGKQSQ